jgi:tetratricopeptide (TPR) repeat protein
VSWWLWLATAFLVPVATAAQTAAECRSAADCIPIREAIDGPHRRLWSEAASIHSLKLEFVAALQRFMRAQAGTFGDEGTELRDSLVAMRAALTRWDAEIDRFRDAAARLERSADAHVIVATVLLDRRRADEALQQLDAADRLDGHRADVHVMRGLAQALRGRSADAERALGTAVSIDAANPAVLYSLAQQARRLQRSKDASDWLDRFRRALSKGGAVRTAAGSPFERVDLLRQQAGVAPLFPSARYSSGFAALNAGEYAMALASFEGAMAGDPLVARELPARQPLVEAAAWLRRGELARAIDILRAADEGSHPEVHRMLGFASWIDGQHARAIEHLRSAIALAPSDERARLILADVLIEEGRASEAERELRRALEAGIRSGQIHLRLAHLYRAQARLPEAVRELEASEAFGPVVGLDAFFQLLGGIHADRAAFSDAAAAYERRIEVNPNHAEGHRQLGEIYFLQGRHTEALAEFVAASWLDPNDARAHAGAGQVHVRLLQYEEAIAPLQRALALDPHLREARYALGSALLRLGRADEGRAALQAFQQQQADAEAAGQREFQLDALRREASRTVNAGALDEAMAMFETILTADPASARSHRDLGMALMRARRPQDAIAHLEAAQRIEETPDGFRLVADALNAAGDRQAATSQMLRYQESLQQAKRDRLRALAAQ